MEPRKRSMAPVGAARPLLLLLGSLPGEASLKAQRYYAHPHNQFWRLVGDALGESLAALDYDERLARLAARQVALWDVVGEAKRVGSLDGALREVSVNRLAEFVARQPQLRAIGFNGLTAARIGRRVLRETGLTLIDLPSSSPAYTLAIAAKATRWSTLANFARAATLGR
ncbi:MAG: DNA-deoxyinosine glycosylase [Sphingomonas bacterium]|nr:DNA-deoxyinosine glycosylase [Sphingomonas bacterium]